MTTNPFVLDMLGDDLKNAVVAAQTRLNDTTIMASCAVGQWSVQRAGADVSTGLSYAAAIAAVAGLS